MMVVGRQVWRRLVRVLSVNLDVGTVASALPHFRLQRPLSPPPWAYTLLTIAMDYLHFLLL